MIDHRHVTRLGLVQCVTHNDLAEEHAYSFGLWCPGSVPEADDLAFTRDTFGGTLPPLFEHCVEVHDRDGACPHHTEDRGCVFRGVYVEVAE